MKTWHTWALAGGILGGSILGALYLQEQTASKKRVPKLPLPPSGLVQVEGCSEIQEADPDAAAAFGQALANSRGWTSLPVSRAVLRERFLQAIWIGLPECAGTTPELYNGILLEERIDKAWGRVQLAKVPGSVVTFKDGPALALGLLEGAL